MAHTTYTWGGTPVTLRVDTDERVSVITRYRSQVTGAERDVVLASIDVRRGVIMSHDGEHPAPADMLAEAREIYGPLPAAAKQARRTRRTRRCSRCDRPAISRASMGWACEDHFDALS